MDGDGIAGEAPRQGAISMNARRTGNRFVGTWTMGAQELLAFDGEIKASDLRVHLDSSRFGGIAYWIGMGDERVASCWRERDVPQANQALALRRGIASDEQLGLPWAPSQSLSEEV